MACRTDPSSRRLCAAARHRQTMSRTCYVPALWLRASIVWLKPMTVSDERRRLSDAVEVERHSGRCGVESEVHLLRLDNHRLRVGEPWILRERYAVARIAVEVMRCGIVNLRS